MADTNCGALRYRRSVPTRADLCIAAVLLVSGQVEVWYFGAAGGGTVGAACLMGVAVASAWRSRAPLLSALGIWVSAFLCAAFSAPPGSLTFVAAAILASFQIGQTLDRRRAYLALAVGLALAVPITEDRTLNSYLAIALTTFLAPWLAGALRLRQLQVLERERERERAVADERARLARELHDLISHSVGMIVVQAGAGDVLLDREPERARDAFHAIEAGARDAMIELRRLLGLMRADDDAVLAPQPSLERLDELAARLRTAGLDVSVSVEGVRQPLDAAIDLSAYCIVQEALTNVVKHARATRARVVIRHAPATLEIHVSDDGVGGPDPTTGGLGLIGIAERVALLGGRLEVGTGDDGGFDLHAFLPAAALPS